MKIRSVKNKSINDIVAEWDALAPIRCQQISSGDDISYNEVIVPNLLRIIKSIKPRSILDVGCGTGIFTSQLSKIGDRVVGVDPSAASIEIARSINDSRAHFFKDTIEGYSKDGADAFDVVVANMVLMDTLSLSGVLESCRQLMAPNGAFIFSITHPCFWPIYYGYAKLNWFRYEDEIAIESPFRISKDRVGSLISTHVHRPLSAYFDAFRSTGFVVRSLQEPLPPESVDAGYKAQWTAPRYLIGSCGAA